MAPVTRASKPKLTPAPAPAPSKADAPNPKKANIPLRSIESHNGVQKPSQKRKARYRSKKRQQALAALEEVTRDPEQTLAKAQLAAVRAAIHQPWTARSGLSRKIKKLEKLVLTQKGEIEDLKKQVGSPAEQGRDLSRAQDSKPKAGDDHDARGSRRTTRRGVA
ncbi:hypothetical protein M406DRAFT_323056 [Cryphonectria parasitica EP155]|uniref:Uncharacterized protein n=1 Tax=Cryphonectria parasitica (strain ATCC 38755 / EP155) TaxID=660469 RepID=A0A9P4XYF5_CRYP1|nr:uncharacterized protein M406DRAFT_323056 [Cryphonectria parasitica EP155]KAF3763214.1 hypothetical protein M406DRAFT_323056 [Cryphonectria parasitica EP155]